MKLLPAKDYPVHSLINTRWSPRAFSDKMIVETDINSMFEAARWAPSAFNEQPWYFIYATSDQTEKFQKLIDCMVPFNQSWAKNASMLVLTVAHTQFNRNGKDNRTAYHDLGLAMGNFVLEGMSRGIYTHQMSVLISILADQLLESKNRMIR